MWIDKDEINNIMLEYDGISTSEATVILLRRDKFSYGGIQKALGNPSKKWIRSVLMKWEPSLIDIKI